MSIEQRYVIHFLMLQGQGCRKIKKQLDETHKEEAYSETKIKYWIKSWKEGRTTGEDLPRSGRPKIDIKELILNFLNDEPYASTKVMAKAFHVDKFVVKRNLLEMNSKKYSKKWLPHLLTNEQKLKRVQESEELLKILKADEPNNFANIITGDESWFNMHYDHAFQWAPNPDSVTPRLRQSINTKKRMVTIFFTGVGLITVKILDPGLKFNSTHFCGCILSSIVKNGRIGTRKKKVKGMFIHMDNCRIHNSKVTTDCIKKSGLIRAPHPPYSPDIAPSDFWFFGYSKNKFAGKSFHDEKELKSAIKEIWDNLTFEDLQNVFHEWINRLEDVIRNNGEYIN